MQKPIKYILQDYHAFVGQVQLQMHKIKHTDTLKKGKLIACKIFLFIVLFENISLYRDVTNDGKELQIQTYARRLWPLSREGPPSCHSCYVMELWLKLSHQKDHSALWPLTTNQGYGGHILSWIGNKKSTAVWSFDIQTMSIENSSRT